MGWRADMRICGAVKRGVLFLGSGDFERLILGPRCCFSGGFVFRDRCGRLISDGLFHVWDGGVEPPFFFMLQQFFSRMKALVFISFLHFQNRSLIALLVYPSIVCIFAHHHPFLFIYFNGGGLGLCSVRSVYTVFGCIFSLLHVFAFFTTTIATGQLLPPLNQKRSHCRKTCCHITTEQMSIRYDYDTKFNDTPQTFASPRVRCDRCLHPDITAHVVLAGPWLRHRLHAGTPLAIPKRFNTQLCKFAAGTYQATSDDLLTVDGKVAQQIEWTEGKKASVASNHICDLNSRSYDPRCCF